MFQFLSGAVKEPNVLLVILSDIMILKPFPYEIKVRGTLVEPYSIYK